MGDMFGSNVEYRETTVDPYESMPDWLREQYEIENEYRRDLIGTAQAEAAALGADPRQIAGMTPEEYHAYTKVADAAQNADARGDAAYQLAAGASYGPHVYTHGYTPGAFDHGYEATEFSHGIDPDRDFTSGYTDDVVDTTLAGMQRQADRERLAREAQAAQVGGTSNTRTAVGNAVADQLTGMNMAEVEAKLRDEAHRFGVESDFTRAGLNLEEQGMSDAALQALAGLNLEEQGMADAAQQALAEFSLESQSLSDTSSLNAANFGLDKSRVINDLATDTLRRGVASGDWLNEWGATKRGIRQERMDAERNAKADSLSWLSGIFAGGQGMQAPVGSTTSSPVEKPSTAAQILGGVSSIAGTIGMLSDKEAKKDIVPMSVGLDALKDVTPATYEYKEGMPTTKKGRTAGLMAQDLEHIPGAVEMGDDGLRRVDPYPVMATIVQAVKDIDGKMRAHGIE